jgi:hypothetical protein
MTLHFIDFNRLDVYEAGAWLVTRLAYPDADDETQGHVHASLCSHALRVRSEIEPDWAIRPQATKPIYSLRSPHDCNRALRTLERRMRHRMVAGRMAIAFLKEALPGHPLILPAGMKRLSINQLAELVLDHSQFTDPDNVETRIWRPSLPVIHLCSAVQIFLSQLEPEIGPVVLEALLLDRDAIELVIRTAVYHETVLAQSRHLRIDPDKVIRIRLI